MKSNLFFVFSLSLVFWAVPAVPVVHSQLDQNILDQIVLDDFESYGDGALPVKWKAQLDGKLVPLTEEFVDDNEWFYAKHEAGRKFVRAYANGETVHINRENGDSFDWDLREHPRMAWEWRANKLPTGAREDDDSKNDSGAGIYVVFSVEGFILKRPKTIKYVYSTTLPVVTVISYGKLKVIVVSSGLNGTGQWLSINRDVVSDYREVFGENPPNRPLFIRLWSDSNNTKSIASADFDNIMLLKD